MPLLAVLLLAHDASPSFLDSTFPGNCSRPGNLYRNNVTMQDDRFNLAYWNYDNLIGEGINATTMGKPGYLWGGAPNSYQWRGPWQAAQGAPLGCIIVAVQGGEAEERAAS